LEREEIDVMGEKFCFVIMGYGKKKDFSGKRPRSLDLDKTFDAIIEPAVKANGLRCVRADKISHSGVIDQHMYEMLLRADLVIADISTGNANALYELGVRHALRPYATIMMKEQEGNFQFDLRQIATFQYKHLGEDIGAAEAAEKVAKLTALITAVMAKTETDSPVYTFLTALAQPVIIERDLAAAVKEMEDSAKDGAAAALAAGRLAANASRHSEARDWFRRACDLQLEATGAADPFAIQQCAVHTYEAGEPSVLAALQAARAIIERLDPEDSTDPETLGIGAAIRKRMWKYEPELAHLDAAIECYGRGFVLKGDYYNGENYAACLDLRAAVQTDASEALYDRTTAKKVRLRVRSGLEAALAEPDVRSRPDYHWMLASMANIAYALGDVATGADHEARFRALNPPAWQVKSFEEARLAVRS
jgi:hypothetical protein